jgi:hypothetical protein
VLDDGEVEVDLVRHVVPAAWVAPGLVSPPLCFPAVDHCPTIGLVTGGFPAARPTGNRKPVDLGPHRRQAEVVSTSKTCTRPASEIYQGEIMRKLIRGVAALATTAAAVVAFTSAAEARPADDWAGCPDGAVCIYPEGQDPLTTPSDVFTTYGAHNLNNQFGNHWVLNNQTGGATANLCKGSDGAGDCGDPIAAGTGVNADLTPINSITLNRP